jgi:hypothetical protein
MPSDDDDDPVADEIADVETSPTSDVTGETETDDGQIDVDYAGGATEEFETEESGDTDEDDDSDGDSDGSDGSDDQYEDQGESFDE